MTDKLKPCKCPKAKYMAQAFDVHFDCLDCPIPTCCSPSIRDDFLKEKEKIDKLKPCPFCGRPAVLKQTPHIPHGIDYTPQCIDPCCCGRLSKKFTVKETAISFWNRRADNDR